MTLAPGVDETLRQGVSVSHPPLLYVFTVNKTIRKGQAHQFSCQGRPQLTSQRLLRTFSLNFRNMMNSSRANIINIPTTLSGHIRVTPLQSLIRHHVSRQRRLLFATSTATRRRTFKINRNSSIRGTSNGVISPPIRSLTRAQLVRAVRRNNQRSKTYQRIRFLNMLLHRRSNQRMVLRNIRSANLVIQSRRTRLTYAPVLTSTSPTIRRRHATRATISNSRHGVIRFSNITTRLLHRYHTINIILRPYKSQIIGVTLRFSTSFVTMRCT